VLNPARFRAAAIAGVLALAACAGPVAGSFSYVSPVYDPALVLDAARAGGVPTAIIGQPFAGADAAFPGRVYALLAMPPWHGPAQFMPADPEPARDYRVVLIFNPAPPGIAFGRACLAANGFALTPPAGDVFVHAAFCFDDQTLTEVDARGLADGVDDPRFRALLAQTLAELLPPANPGQDEACRRSLGRQC
jgi:hypothetical protein